MGLPYDPVIPLLGIYSKKPETQIKKNTCTSTFIPALFTIAKMWKQLNCPSVDEQIKTVVVCVYIYIYTHTHTHTMED